MILAASEAARNADAPAPPELRWMWECLDTGALPNGPSLWDQPAGLVARMRWCHRVYETTRDLLSSKNWREWQERNPDGWKIYCWVIRLRQAHERLH